MAKGRSRGSKPFGHVKTPVVKPPSDKDVNRAAVRGRQAQGLGSAGRPGGTKSSGGKAGSAKGRPPRTGKGGRKGGGGSAS